MGTELACDCCASPFMAGEPDASAETQAVAPVQDKPDAAPAETQTVAPVQDKPDAAPAETQAVAPVYGKEEGTDFVTLEHEGITWYHSDAVDALKREATEAKAGEVEYKRVDSDHQTALQ